MTSPSLVHPAALFLISSHLQQNWIGEHAPFLILALSNSPWVIIVGVAITRTSFSHEVSCFSNFNFIPTRILFKEGKQQLKVSNVHGPKRALIPLDLVLISLSLVPC